jgi:hypothetical protein
MDMMDKQLLYNYRNGNYNVKIYSDGTKIRETDEDEFIPAFAENCDVKITDCCDGGCPFCYEGCTPKGQHARLFYTCVVPKVDENNNVLKYVEEFVPAQLWLKHLHPGTELALNGNDLTHPDLNPNFPVLLHWLKDHQVIANMTVNQKHFMLHKDLLKKWCDQKLIWGLGVSLNNAEEPGFFEVLKEFPNAVLHTIIGILTVDDIVKIRQVGNLKVLILGYKTLGRGITYLEKANYIELNKEVLRGNIPALLKTQKVISFDNLALEQLGVKDLLFKDKKQEWDEFYMGDDGTMTFYIDAVKEQYAKNSCMPLEDRFGSRGLTIDEMFKNIRKL